MKLALPIVHKLHPCGYSYIQGFIQRRWGEIPPPPGNLQIEYGYHCGAINISYLILHVTVTLQYLVT